MLNQPQWSDGAIRNACIIGTLKEFEAYLKAGYTLNPTPAINPTPILSPLGDYLEIPASMAELSELVCRKHKISQAQLIGSSRKKRLTQARSEFCILSYNKLGKSTMQIGKFLRRDHTTILHYIRWSNNEYREKYRAKRVQYYHAVKARRECQRQLARGNYRSF